MTRRWRIRDLLLCIAVLAASATIARSTRAQTCPDGYTLCSGDSTSGGGICIQGSSCTIPDSNITNCTGVVTTVKPPRPTRLLSMGLSVDPLASEGAALEAAVRSMNSTLAEFALIRRRTTDQWKWVLATQGLAPSATVNVRLMSGSSVVLEGAQPTGTRFAEASALPSNLTVATASAGMTTTWGFAGPVEVRTVDRSGVAGKTVKADRIEVTTSGGASELGSVQFRALGLGTLRLGGIRSTPMAASR